MYGEIVDFCNIDFKIVFFLLVISCQYNIRIVYGKIVDFCNYFKIVLFNSLP